MTEMKALGHAETVAAGVLGPKTHQECRHDTGRAETQNYKEQHRALLWRFLPRRCRRSQALCIRQRI